MRLILILLLIPLALSAQVKSDDLRLFRSDTLLTLTLESNFGKILDNPTEQEDRIDGIIEYEDTQGIKHKIKTNLEPRGGYRLAPSNCSFPPISLKFPEKNKGTLFEDVTKLKLVVHCRKAKRFEQYVAKEYLCYRFFNQLTDTSFRVRPAQIKYVNGPSGDTLYRRFGFFIERTRHLRARNNVQEADDENITVKWLDDYQAHRLSLFQYMIGNSDWSVYSGHNTKRVKSDGKHFAVPYDFDWSGFVNASYAVPHPKYQIKDVTERVYIGKEINKPVFRKVAEVFKQKKTVFIGMVEKCPFLDKKNKRRTIRYLDAFYERIESEKKLNYFFFQRD